MIARTSCRAHCHHCLRVPQIERVIYFSGSIGATSPHSFALEVFVQCESETRFWRLCQPFLYSLSSLNVLEVEVIIIPRRQFVVQGEQMSMIERALQMSGLQIPMPAPDLAPPSTSQPLRPANTQ